ncbi:hypothetical protein DID88_010278 [Monilinia fructigena]|uniref:DUF7082 domain-containing protein n=1 Tax=Monilinia fructigena TaxID=38457 RepID=A0A395IS77_9HELO|nr:hypothetical protein DID88_010278 [Monilinia fructigena]
MLLTSCPYYTTFLDHWQILSKTQETSNSLSFSFRNIIDPLNSHPTAKLAYSTYTLFDSEHLSSGRPIIIDETYPSPETTALHEGGYDGGLVPRADSPTDILSMSAYGKPQPPQLHGYETGRSYSDNAFPYSTPSYGSQSSIPTSTPTPSLPQCCTDDSSRLCIRVPVSMFMEGDGDVISKIEVGEFTYENGPQSMEGTRKRKISTESAELMKSPAKRNSQQIKPKEEFPYAFSSSDGSPSSYSPYLQASSTYGNLMPQYSRTSGAYQAQAAPRNMGYGYGNSSTASPPTLRAHSPHQSTWNPGPGAAPTYNPYPVYANKAKLDISGELADMMVANWTAEEWESKRRLVQFKRSQSGCTITTTFNPISADERPPNGVVISCIFWEEKNDCYVTSVDTITLLEALVAAKFTVEEKNRIRRNLEGFRPATVSKGKPDSEEFFKVIMAFPNPKPRNIEKDVKVFHWKDLGPALKKIIGKYSASPSSTLPPAHAPALLTPVSSTGYATETSSAGLTYTNDHHGGISPRSISGSATSTAYNSTIPYHMVHRKSSHWPQGNTHHMPAQQQQYQAQLGNTAAVAASARGLMGLIELP